MRMKGTRRVRSRDASASALVDYISFRYFESFLSLMLEVLKKRAKSKDI